MKFVNATSPEFSTAVANAKARKSVFQQSRFLNGMTLEVTGFTFVVDEDDKKAKPAERKAYPVLQTTLNGQPFDNIFLSTLCRDIITADGESLTPDGSLNRTAIGLVTDPVVKTDEEVLQRLVQACQGHKVLVKRDRGYKRLTRTGSVMPSVMLEFELQ